MENANMTSLNTKLVLSALGIALLASPAFAQKSHHRAAAQTEIQDSAAQNGGYGFGVYPNPITHSGSAMSREMGNNTIGGTD
jgi:hypothetical protein